MENGNKTDNLPNRPVSPINGQPIPNGRPKGVPNKATTQFKTALNQLFETAAPEMVKWLEQVDNAKDRFDILAKFADYLYPKLARSELQALDRDGNPAEMKVEINFVASDKNSNT